ncbi:MAG: hypothetical protein SangKO_056460 [Sandaracinaceae bacterium]
MHEPILRWAERSPRGAACALLGASTLLALVSLAQILGDAAVRSGLRLPLAGVVAGVGLVQLVTGAPPSRMRRAPLSRVVGAAALIGGALGLALARVLSGSWL